MSAKISEEDVANRLCRYVRHGIDYENDELIWDEENGVSPGPEENGFTVKTADGGVFWVEVMRVK